MHAAEPLSHFVDAYLTYLYEACPTQATFDGVHLNDDLLEDYRRTAIDRHLGALAGFARRLDAIPAEGLTPGEQADRAMVEANIRSRQFDLEVTRAWVPNRADPDWAAAGSEWFRLADHLPYVVDLAPAGPTT